MKLISDKKKKLLLNITPLVDVLLILIVFFVVTSTFMEQPGIKLELPKSQTADLQRVEKAVLMVSEDSKLYFRNKEVSLNELPAILNDAMQESIDKSLIISADKVVHHGLIISIMDIARQSGVQKLVVSTEPE